MRRAWLCLLLPALLLAGGCWDYRDLENRVFIMALALDVDDGGEGGGHGKRGYRVAVEIPHPHEVQGGDTQGGGGGGSGKAIFRERGTTPADAVLRLSRRIERVPLWEQMTAVIVSEEAAEEGLAPLFDLFMRHVGMSARARLFVAEGTAGDLLAFEPLLQPLTSRVLRGFEQQFAFRPRFAKPLNIRGIDYREDGVAALVPRIRMAEGELQIGGAAVLSRHRMLGRLNEEETEGANWLLGLVKQTALEVPCPGTPDGRVTLRVAAGDRRLRITEDGPSPRFRYDLSAQGWILEMYHCPLNPVRPADRRRLEEAAVRVIRQRGEAAIRQAQHGIGSDFLRLGVELRRRRPDLWRRMDPWPERFPTVSVSVEARVEIRDVGGIDPLATR